MTVEERMRWRTNPAVIGRYYTGEEVPADIDVHLKPNEACAVIEDGAIVGVATSTRMTVNPKLGLLSRILQRKEPYRAFMFVHTGPHEILIRIEGRWADGEIGKGVAGLKVSFDPDNLGKMLEFPSKGDNEITVGAIASKIELEISNKFAAKEMSQFSSSTASTDRDAMVLLNGALFKVATPVLAEFGAKLGRMWLSWAESEYERLMRKRNDLENMVAEGKILDEIAEEEIRREVDEQIKVLEARYLLKVAAEEYAAKEETIPKIAEERAWSEFDIEREDAHSKRLTRRAERDRAFEGGKIQHKREQEKDEIGHETEMDRLREERASKTRKSAHEQEMKDIERKAEKARLAMEKTGFFDDDD